MKRYNIQIVKDDKKELKVIMVEDRNGSYCYYIDAEYEISLVKDHADALNNSIGCTQMALARETSYSERLKEENKRLKKERFKFWKCI